MSVCLPIELWSEILFWIEAPLDWIQAGSVSTDFQRIVQSQHWSAVHTLSVRKQNDQSGNWPVHGTVTNRWKYVA